MKPDVAAVLIMGAVVAVVVIILVVRGMSAVPGARPAPEPPTSIPARLVRLVRWLVMAVAGLVAALIVLDFLVTALS
ncbi:hypothetical protein KIH74_04975 [Kineosporia sp. J2-2]|uniref:Uncharacterized protein n=1 Tax=Kineosporia corallincola TaxID=2835133 RepID=A0ABS5TBP6_9ACTN|nr:hypothetical protein [Kineosporia corallincola]MBT0768263.1 hypothetical protein [Kineosporia corallincola]